MAAELTLRQFLFADGQEPAVGNGEAFSSAAPVAAIREKLAAAAGGLPWPAVAGEIGRNIASLLDIPLKDILRGGWEKAAEIRKALDKGTGSPGETLLVPLARHKMSSTHRPALDILLGEEKLGSIVFSVTLALQLEGMVLVVRGGEIREVRTGVCQGSGRLSCEDFLLLERKTERIPLPGVIAFGGKET